MGAWLREMGFGPFGHPATDGLDLSSVHMGSSRPTTGGPAARGEAARIPPPCLRWAPPRVSSDTRPVQRSLQTPCVRRRDTPSLPISFHHKEIFAHPWAEHPRMPQRPAPLTGPGPRLSGVLPAAPGAGPGDSLEASGVLSPQQLGSRTVFSPLSSQQGPWLVVQIPQGLNSDHGRGRGWAQSSLLWLLQRTPQPRRRLKPRPHVGFGPSQDVREREPLVRARRGWSLELRMWSPEETGRAREAGDGFLHPVSQTHWLRSCFTSGPA